MRVSTELCDEHGYTLMETVVSIALFVSVLIPLGVLIGHFLSDGSAVRLHQALCAAETEMSQVVLDQDFTGDGRRIHQHLFIRRKALRFRNRVEIDIVVAPLADPERHIVVLHKSLLVVQ